MMHNQKAAYAAPLESVSEQVLKSIHRKIGKQQKKYQDMDKQWNRTMLGEDRIYEGYADGLNYVLRLLEKECGKSLFK